MQAVGNKPVVVTECGIKMRFISSLTYCKTEIDGLIKYYRFSKNQRVKSIDGLQSTIHHKKD